MHKVYHKDGYKYKTELDLAVISNGSDSGIMSIYFSDEIKNGNNVNCLINADTLGIDEAIGLLNNIQIPLFLKQMKWLYISVFSVISQNFEIGLAYL